MALHFTSSGVTDGSSTALTLDTTVNSEAQLTDRQVGSRGAIVQQNDGIQAVSGHGEFSTYYRRISMANRGYEGSPTHTAVYHWFTINGLDSPPSGGCSGYIELRVFGLSGHAGGSRMRTIGIAITGYGAGMASGFRAATSMNSGAPGSAYSNLMDCYFFGNNNNDHTIYMKVHQAMREPKIAVWADIYTINTQTHRHRNFDMVYHGQSTSQEQMKPSGSHSTVRAQSTGETGAH